MDENLRDTLLEVIETSLEAQLLAVRRLRFPGPSFDKTAAAVGRPRRKGRSQVEMAFDVLSSGQPLHIKEILAAIRERFQTEVDRESLVSALSKRVARQDRFQRVGKNIFSLLTPSPPPPPP